MLYKRELFLIRHAPTEFNQKQLMLGRKDVDIVRQDLNPEIFRSRLEYKTIDGYTIYSSPLRRCLQTAEFLLPPEKIKSIKIDNRISEFDVGELEGRMAHPNLLWTYIARPGICIPGGESLDQFFERVRDFYTNISSNALVFTHGGVINAIIMMALNLPNSKFPLFEIENISLTKITINDDSVFINYINRSSEKNGL